MTLAARALGEYAALARVLPGGMLLRLLAATLANLAPILRTRTLTALDAAMSRNCAVRYHGCLIQLPLAELDGLLAGTGDNPVFGNLREMFANDVYLRAFPRQPRAEYALFAAGGDWLAALGALVMELHPGLGDNRIIVSRLEAAGLAGLATDRAGRPAPLMAAEFLYASRAGDLPGSSTRLPAAGGVR